MLPHVSVALFVLGTLKCQVSRGMPDLVEISRIVWDTQEKSFSHHDWNNYTETLKACKNSLPNSYTWRFQYRKAQSDIWTAINKNGKLNVFLEKISSNELLFLFTHQEQCQTILCILHCVVNLQMLPADVEEALLARAIKAFTKASNHLSKTSYLFVVNHVGQINRAVLCVKNYSNSFTLHVLMLFQSLYFIITSLHKR